MFCKPRQSDDNGESNHGHDIMNMMITMMVTCQPGQSQMSVCPLWCPLSQWEAGISNHYLGLIEYFFNSKSPKFDVSKAAIGWYQFYPGRHLFLYNSAILKNQLPVDFPLNIFCRRDLDLRVWY